MEQQEHYEGFGRQEPKMDASLGRNKSGRPWKLGVNSKPHKMTTANKALQMTWDEKMQRKAQMKQLRDRLKQFRERKQQKKKEDKQRRKEKRRQKELNELKAGKFELIKDPKKIKKWNRKVRDQLVKLPAEMFENLVNGRN